MLYNSRCWYQCLLLLLGVHNILSINSFSFRGIRQGIVSSTSVLSAVPETYINFERENQRDDGLSKFHRRLLSTNAQRQRFVTGKYPVYISIRDSPTKRWLSMAKRRIKSDEGTISSAQVYVNGTLVDLSMASLDKLGWLDDDEGVCYSLELIAEIHTKNPCYVNILPSVNDITAGNSVRMPGNDILWVTDFSLTRPGGVSKLDVKTGELSKISSWLTWPNEVTHVPVQCYSPPVLKENNQANDHYVLCSCDETDNEIKSILTQQKMENALLVTDGFLVPGRDDGGVFVVKQPGTGREWKVCICGNDETGWYYHRAVWIDLTNDGRQSVLAARARSPIPGRPLEENVGELVFIERPRPYRYDEETGTPLDVDGTVFDPFGPRHLPWKTTILDEGPDVMFCVADLDEKDNSVEIIASQFFGKKVTLHSVEKGLNPRVNFRRVIDDRCGSSFSAILSDLRPNCLSIEGEIDPKVIDNGSTIQTLSAGDTFSHLLVTSHECSFEDSIEGESVGESHVRDDSFVSNVEVGNHLKYPGTGGSLYAYRVPSSWKIDQWERKIIATGFRVRGQLGNMINPGAPGFCYTFYPTQDGSKRWKRPYIGIAGDCAEAAYILRPDDSNSCTKKDSDTNYALMCEIECGGTVGSLALSYEDCFGAPSEKGWAKMYIPCYERDRIFVFGMGCGEEEGT